MPAIPLDSTVVAAPDQLSTDLAGEVVILGLTDSMYYGLADVGARLWKALQTPRSVGDLLALITVEYDVERDRAEDDLQRFLQDLLQRGLITMALPAPRLHHP